jgi:distribution and morphology protein 10
MLSLQQDVGRWSAEYTYSMEDGMIGLRGLYNFGMTKLGMGTDGRDERNAVDGDGKRVDEEEAMEGGLRGRFSAGAELYFSKKQRSLGGEAVFALDAFRRA